MVCQKVPKLYFQSQFSMSKIDRIFSKKKSFKNINLRDHFWKKSVDFGHRTLTLKVRFWHFLTNHNSL